MNRSKREDYKRFVVFCLASLIVIAQAAIFAYVWYDFYSDLILKPFWRKGNWVMILIYALIYLMFAKLYGGLKVGYLKRIDVFYSLTLATICTNVVTYFQITLINRVYVGQTGDRNDRSPACCDGTVDLGLQVYLLQTVRSQKAAGDLRRP